MYNLHVKFLKHLMLTLCILVHRGQYVTFNVNRLIFHPNCHLTSYSVRSNAFIFISQQFYEDVCTLESPIRKCVSQFIGIYCVSRILDYWNYETYWFAVFIMCTLL